MQYKKLAESFGLGMTLTSTFLFLFVAGVQGWLTTSQDQQDAAALSLASLARSNGALNRIWASPADSGSDYGLGGGITFAYDDEKICGDLLPSFSESSRLWGVAFIDCDSIKAAIRSAFASWSSNHPSIKFHDVTADCKMAGDTSGGPLSEGCSRAEIWLTTTSNETSQDAAATTLNVYRWDSNFRHPNGAHADPGLYGASSRSLDLRVSPPTSPLLC